MQPQFVDVPVGRVFLYLENPRHEPVETEPQAIERLCATEDVYALARDIAKFGLSPLERLALVPTGKKSATSQNYVVPEGNRRMCAIKLLNDPDLAPAALRKPFEKLSQSWSPIATIPGAVFESLADVRHWLDRTHNGPQGGIGRKAWNADQKARFDGGNKNKPAQAFLDYAEREKMITAADRKGKLTTVQRFLGNVVFKETLGFDQTNPDDFGRTRPKADFDVIAKRFVQDLVVGKNVNSRMNKNEITGYGRRMGTLEGLTGERIETESLASEPEAGKAKATRRKKPKKPEKAKHVQYEEMIFNALRSYGNEKLQSLYHSICSIDLDPHTPIVAVGTWSFFETLTACAGRNDGVSFESFLSKNRLQGFGIKGDLVSLRSAMERVREFGNTTKHHPLAAAFNGDQLHNDMNTLKEVILKCIQEAVKQGI
jgi:hypothetical protein